MEQTYEIKQDGLGTYHFHGRTVLDDGGTFSREYAEGLDLENVRARGVQEMKDEARRLQTTVVEGGKLDEAHAKVEAARVPVSIRATALAKLTAEERAVLRVDPPTDDEV
jgi:hypothetical protein